MSKLKIVERKSEKSINFEREILSKLHNPFIVNMYYAFQDKDNLYLVMDYLKGGDLRFHLTRHIRFSEEQTRFFICNIITALEYIHSKNIIHRDIKPENLVLEEEGYVRITDFGIAKKSKDNNKGDTSGTPGYMAPEVMRGAVHSFEVDFFAIGIIGYEFMKGKRPYAGKSRKEIREEMLMKQIFIKNEDIEEGWTKESVDFFNKLLIRKKENRLGFKGIIELKEHPWIKYYPWNMINDKSLPSPFVPQNKDNFDLRYCARSEKIGEETKMRYEEILMDKNYQNIFKNFFFNFDYEKKLLLKKKEKEDTINDNKNIINNIYYKVQKCNNNNLNSKNSFFNKKSSYKQLPFSQNKIILDNMKDKYNTINEVNDKKKNNNDNMDDSLYSAIFKKERLKKINSIIESKLKNNNIVQNKKIKNYKSNPNLVTNENPNKNTNHNLKKRHINISNIISPARSDKYLLKNNGNQSSKNYFKKNKQKSFILNSKSEFNNSSNNNKTPIFHNKDETINKREISQNLNKYLTLLSKSNSYRIKNNSRSKNKSIKKIIYNKKSNHISYNLTNNLISSNLNHKNIFENKNLNNELLEKINKVNKNLNNEMQESLLYSRDGKYIKKNKSRMHSNDNITKNKINTTSNNSNANNNNSINANKTNGSINKTFFKELKIKEVKKELSQRSNENLLIARRIINDNNNQGKKIFINNKKLNINESIRNLIRYNSKYLSFKDLNTDKTKNVINSKDNININNHNDKENIDINLINNNIRNNSKKRLVIKNDGKKQRIFVNKRAKNKVVAHEVEKTKYIFNNNSINAIKNLFNKRIVKSKANFNTLNNNSLKNINLKKGKKDEQHIYKNIVLSYKQNRNLSTLEDK